MGVRVDIFLTVEYHEYLPCRNEGSGSPRKKAGMRKMIVARQRGRAPRELLRIFAIIPSRNENAYAFLRSEK
jgi:hypothetical protein